MQAHHKFMLMYLDMIARLCMHILRWVIPIASAFDSIHNDWVDEIVDLRQAMIQEGVLDLNEYRLP